MIIVTYILVLILHISFCQHEKNNGGRNYYFKMGKRSNEFKIKNRVYFLNHNITDHDYSYTYRPIEKVRVISTSETNMNFLQNDENHLLDEEWNFDHNSISKRELPLFIHKLYESQSDSVPTTTTTRILFNCNKNSTRRIIWFNLNSLNPNETLLDAELYFFWPLAETSEIYRESVVLRLYQFERQANGIINESNQIENPDVHKLFNVIYISKAQRGWQTFKIKKPIDNWLNGEENLGLILTISSYDANKLISVFDDINQGIYNTFAIVTVENNGTASKNKDILDHTVHSPSPYCQRKEWNINFKSLSWDKFIITPDGFTAYDCAGKCIKSQTDQVNHLKLLYTFNRRSPCCVPSKYLPLPIMFYDKFGNVVIKSYQNMIASKCGCR